MSGTSAGIYSNIYRENANPDAFEMDNLRARVYDVETKLSVLKAKKRIGFALAIAGVLGLAFDGAYAYRLNHADPPCKDVIVEAPTHGAGLSCPHPAQEMDTHTIVMPAPQADVWAVRCLCKR